MKIDFSSEKIIIYLYQYQLNTNNLYDEIRNIIIKLIKKYKINFYGYSVVSIYNNDKYGSILEIENIYESNEYNLNNIDLRINIYKNVTMYLEFDDIFFNDIKKHLIVKKNKYYIDIKNIDNLLEYIEYGRIKYKNDI